MRVYVDTNLNGVYNAGEPTAITDSSGAYRIYGLAAGTHTVRYDLSTVPSGYIPTTADSVTYVLAAGEQYSLAISACRRRLRRGQLPGPSETMSGSTRTTTAFSPVNRGFPASR